MKKIVLFFLLFSFVNLLSAQVIITTIAGNGTPGYSGDGLQATTAQLKYPDGLAVDLFGNVYIGDQSHVIRKIDPTGIITTFAGNGISGYFGDGGLATNAQLKEANYIITDKKGNVYFSDLLNQRVRKIDISGIITTIAGNGSSTVTGLGGPATAAGIGPGGGGICFDDTGSMFISAPYQILKVDTFGTITNYAGTGVSGFAGDGGLATAAQLIGGGQLAMGIYGDLFVTDAMNKRVRKVTPSGIISTFAGKSTSGFSGDGGLATSAELNGPIGVFSDKCGNIFISDPDNQRVRMVNTAGIIASIAGTGLSGYFGDGMSPMVAKFNQPGSIYFDKIGNLYITDHYNNVIRKVVYPACIDNLETTLQPSNLNLTLYPNPATDELILTSDPMTYTSLIIINNLGVQVFHQEIKSGTTHISIRALPSGAYTLLVRGYSGLTRHCFIKTEK